MIKELIKYQLVDVTKLILRFYAKLELSDLEAMVLIHLFQTGDKIKFPTPYTQLKNKTSLNKKEIGDLLNSLESKGFISIELEVKNNDKDLEIIDLSSAITKFEMLFANIALEEEKKQIEANAKAFVNIFERELEREFTPSESQIILELSKKYTIQDVEKAIFEVSKKGQLIVSEVANYLKNEEIINGEVDKKYEDAIMGVFKSINK